MNKEELISIGQILKPHGIKGEMRVLSFSSFSERFKALKNVFLSLNEKLELFFVESARFHKKFVLIKLKGIDKREEVEIWRGADLMIKEEEIWKKNENFYYFHELIGLPCYLRSGKFLGNVLRIEEVGEKANLVIQEENDLEQLIPFIKDFVEVERGKKIIIKPIPGLLSKK